MKKQIYRQTIFLLTWLLFVVSINAQSEYVKDDFDKLSLDAKTSKINYIPLEPILLQLKVVNRMNENLTLNTKPDFKRILVEITSKGETRTFASPFLIGPGRSAFGGIFEKNQTLSKDVLLDTYLEEMFPAYGKYNVRIILTNGRDDEMKASFKSNTIEINIKEPSGINKEAIGFLRQNQNKSLFWWKEVNENASMAKDGKSLIEIFADKYAVSVFGEYAILNLSQYYLSDGKTEKAKLELEKIKLSSNNYISEEAVGLLTELGKSNK